MLKVWVKGFREGCIKNPDRWFNMHKKTEWFNRKDVRNIIKEIDNSEVLFDEVIKSPVYGGMAPDRLSSGCKALILLCIDPECNVYASRMGDNCSKFLVELSRDKDVVVTLHHLMRFDRDVNFQAEFLDSGVITNTPLEFATEFLMITGDLSRV